MAELELRLATLVGKLPVGVQHWLPRGICKSDRNFFFNITALPAAMRYILKAESYDRREAEKKLYCIIAGSAVKATPAACSPSRKVVSLI